MGASLVAQVAALTRRHFRGTDSALTARKLADKKFLVRRIGGKIAGYLVYSETAYRAGHPGTVYIWALAAKRGFRRRGVAAGLLRKLMRLSHYSLVVTYSHRDNRGMNAAFRKLGFNCTNPDSPVWLRWVWWGS